MIRFAEAVLAGHPDKFCDQVADAIVAEALVCDPAAFVQVEVGIWSDQAWLSGRIITSKPLLASPSELLVRTGLELGLDEANWIDARRYHVNDTICAETGDPMEWRSVCDDQSIVIGYAGYDEKTRWLPPEHFLAHLCREALWTACAGGALPGLGPDGKLLITLREEGSAWSVERILVTIQHRQDISLLDVSTAVQDTLEQGYLRARTLDPRWSTPWEDIELMINPNGPLVRGGSDGDNGQTGRKLVMDYYGPRIRIGGGALSGKHPAHIDRAAAYAARSAALNAVRTGAKECTVSLAYAPNRDRPLEIVWETDGKGERRSRSYFGFEALRGYVPPTSISRRLGSGEHFWDPTLPWNC